MHGEALDTDYSKQSGHGVHSGITTHIFLATNMTNFFHPTDLVDFTPAPVHPTDIADFLGTLIHPTSTVDFTNIGPELAQAACHAVPGFIRQPSSFPSSTLGNNATEISEEGYHATSQSGIPPSVAVSVDLDIGSQPPFSNSSLP